MILKKLYLSLFFVLMVLTVHSQPGAGDPNGGGKPGSVPISGIEILIAVGGLLGIKKIIAQKKRNSS
jgi:hypothetical protein